LRLAVRTKTPTYQLHAKQKVILMFDQKLEHCLAQRMLGRPHFVLGMRDDSRLENDREVWMQAL